MQAKVLLLSLALAAVGAASLDAADRRGDRPDENGRRVRPEIYINPSDFLNRAPRPNVDEPAFIMAELETCVASGIRLFVDCLRANHSPIMIRRLESCVFSETIPDDPREVAACLPPVRVR